MGEAKPDNTVAEIREGVSPHHNRFDRLEWAGAFGDLGTLVPFVVAYITLLRMDPFGILFAFGVTLLLLGSRRFPVMFLLLIGGGAYQLVIAPELAAQLASVRPELRFPSLFFASVGWSDIAIGVLLLALPQMPLTLGNAVVL